MIRFSTLLALALLLAGCATDREVDWKMLPTHYDSFRRGTAR